MDKRINILLENIFKELLIEPIASVAVILNDKGQVLLGKSLADDDRKDKLCFIGGGIEIGETPVDAALREASEEANIIVTVTEDNFLGHDPIKNVVFIKCLYNSGEIKPNEEFEFLNWYDLHQPPNEDIYNQNLGIIEKIKTPLITNYFF